MNCPVFNYSVYAPTSNDYSSSYGQGECSSTIQVFQHLGWLTETDPCNATGWYCSNNRVVAIQLSSSNLNGEIPTEIGTLSKLQALVVDGNQLNGTIPWILGLLPNLQLIRLDNNQLSGSIPSSLLGLSDLIYLTLSSNYLTGSIPSFTQTLQFLDLSSNLLYGNIPNNLNVVQYLNLSSNYLTGSIPFSLVYNPPDNFLDLSHNLLSGSVPSPTGSIASIYLKNNNFICPVPNYQYQSGGSSYRTTCYVYINGYPCDISACYDGNSSTTCQNELCGCYGYEADTCNGPSLLTTASNNTQCSSQNGSTSDYSYYSSLNCSSFEFNCQSSGCLQGICLSNGVCQCYDGYHGQRCDQQNNLCLNKPCQNGGLCGGNNINFTCTCPDGYSGNTCQESNFFFFFFFFPFLFSFRPFPFPLLFFVFIQVSFL